MAIILPKNLDLPSKYRTEKNTKNCVEIASPSGNRTTQNMNCICGLIYKDDSESICQKVTDAPK